MRQNKTAIDFNRTLLEYEQHGMEAKAQTLKQMVWFWIGMPQIRIAGIDQGGFSENKTTLE